jgi:hypothetical protein
VKAAEPFGIFRLNPLLSFLFGELFWFAFDEVIVDLNVVLHNF